MESRGEYETPGPWHGRRTTGSDDDIAPLGRSASPSYDIRRWGGAASAGEAGEGGEDRGLPHHVDQHPAHPVAPPNDLWMRRLRWARFQINRDILEHPIVRIGFYAALTLLVFYTGAYFYSAFGGSDVCGRVSLPGYTSECLMIDIPRTLPRTPYQPIARPTWRDLQQPVLHLRYNGRPVDIVPETLFRRFAEISGASYDECICGAAYGLGVSLSAIHGEVYLSPRMNSESGIVQWTQVNIAPPPRFRALRFTQTSYRAPRHAYYDYLTPNGEYHDVALSGTRSACVALCAEVEALLGAE